MDLISQRVLELLQEQRQSQTIRVTAVFSQATQGRTVPFSSSPPRSIPGVPPCALTRSLERSLDLVPVYPCDGITDQESGRRSFIIEVNGVSFYPKLDVVISLVQTWMDEFIDHVRGAVNTGAKCEVTGLSSGQTVYSKRVAFDYSDNASKTRKNVNRIVQEIMRVKSLGQNMVFTSPGPSQRIIV
jgi:hypothetical protein